MHDCESDQSVDNQQGKMATHKVFFFFWNKSSQILLISTSFKHTISKHYTGYLFPTLLHKLMKAFYRKLL